jgi:DNA-binding GntR family transcriptional regulator
MARAVVQAERLSNQVYELLREDLLTGQFAPGQRLVEVELAERYRVSRTPVREALVQLSRDGLLVGTERGYSTPSFTRADIMNRLEVKRLLEPRMAELAAAGAEPQQTKALAKSLEREKSAHQAGKVKAFNAASQESHRIYWSMCKNELLVRCVSMVDSQFELVRSRIHENPENREKTIEFNERLYQAIIARDRAAARKARLDMLAFLDVYYSEHKLAEFG